MNNLLRAIIPFTMLCISVTAVADPADDAYERGIALFNAKDYANARAEFEKAHDLSPAPNLLVIIAETYLAEGNMKQALAYYKDALAKPTLNETVRINTEARVAWIEAQLKTLDAPKQIESDVGPRERAPVSAPVDVAIRGSRTVWSTRREIAVGAAAGGVLALVAGGMLGASAESKQRDAHVLCPDPQLSCDDADRANALIGSAADRAIGADVAFGIGAAAAIAAGVLWFTGAPKSQRRIAIVPAASPGQLTVVASRRF